MTAPFSSRDFLRSRGAVLVHFSTVMSSHPDLLYPADMRNALSLKGVAHNAQPGKMAAQLRARILWQWCSLRRAHSFEFLDLALSRPQSANAEACKNGLHLVHDSGLLGDQILPLTVRPPRVRLLDCRDRRHAAMPSLAAQPSEKGPHQEFRIEAIGLRAPVFA